VSPDAWFLSACEYEVEQECLSSALPAEMHRIFAFHVGEALGQVYLGSIGTHPMFLAEQLHRHSDALSSSLIEAKSE
jgi:hypothetical protein